MQGIQRMKKPVSRVEFIGALFTKLKPPIWVGRILASDLSHVPVDSLKAVRKWAAEAGMVGLDVFIQGNISDRDTAAVSLTEAARNCIFAAAQLKEDPVISDFLFQYGGELIEKGLAENPNNVALHNAKIIYLSEYEEQPMKFLAEMRSTLAIDSNNIETNLIRMNLLKKSEQWKKAVETCRKLISLQPQNPDWLFEASDLYGIQGDSVNAKLYLNLAIKVRNTKKK